MMRGRVGEEGRMGWLEGKREGGREGEWEGREGEWEGRDGGEEGDRK